MALPEEFTKNWLSRSPELTMEKVNLKERLVNLGFSEQAATEVSDFLGSRVYTGEKENRIKRRDPLSNDPA